MIAEVHLQGICPDIEENYKHGDTEVSLTNSPTTSPSSETHLDLPVSFLPTIKHEQTPKDHQTAEECLYDTRSNKQATNREKQLG